MDITLITVQRGHGPVMTAIVIERGGPNSEPVVHLPKEMATQKTLVSLDRLGGTILAQLPDAPKQPA